MNASLLLLCLLLALARALRPGQRRVCAVETKMEHRSVPVPFAAAVPLKVRMTLHFRCDERGRAVRPQRRRRPLLVLMPDAVVRARDYSALATRLAQRRFVVAVPQYSRRRLFDVYPRFASFRDLIRRRRRAGFECPRNGVFSTAELVNSVFKFFLSGRRRLRDVRAVADLKRTVIFGHGLGGTAAQLVFNGRCGAVSSPVHPPPQDLASNPETPLRTACEQYKPLNSPGVKIVGYVGYETLGAEKLPINVSGGRFFVELHSPFLSDQVVYVLDGLPFGGKFVKVLIGNANHFGPNNFVDGLFDQTPICTLARAPPENAFRTDGFSQNRVIKSIARVIDSSFSVFVRGSREDRLTALTTDDSLFVEQVDFL